MTDRRIVSNRIFRLPAIARTSAIAALTLSALSTTALADNLTGTTSDDLLVGAVASSAITGKEGNDILFGEPGAAMGLIASITRVSTTSTGAQANGYSETPSLSPDGNRVLFASNASNLVPDDTNGTYDLVEKNLETGAITLVSSNSAGTQGNSIPLYFNYSPDGKSIAFSSTSTNLVVGDGNGAFDIFIKNLETGVTTRASTNASSTEGNGSSYIASFSPDGTKLLFGSGASNLVSGDTNAKADIFLKDLTTGAISRVSTRSDGTEGSDNAGYGVFMPDGKNILFYSDAPNLVAGDTNAKIDMFIKNIDSGNISIISSNASGIEGNDDSFLPLVSPDGTKAIFASKATNLVSGDTNAATDIFIKDIVSGKISRISTSATGVEGDLPSSYDVPSGYSLFSADGSKFVIVSSATNLVTGDTNAANDIFLVDLAKATGGNDVISGNQGADQLFGVPGDDTLNGGPGPDILNGGSGKDTADYSTSANAVKVSLQTGRGRGGDAQGDRLSAIENLTGSAKGDLLIGNAASNRLTGGKGLDKLSGKAGADRFVFAAIADSPAATPDIITDFKLAEKDKIDLSAIDAKPATAANDAFTYIKVAAFSKSAGELRFNAATHHLEADTTGDGKADLAVTLTGINALPASRIIP